MKKLIVISAFLLFFSGKIENIDAGVQDDKHIQVPLDEKLKRWENRVAELDSLISKLS